MLSTMLISNRKAAAVEKQKELQNVVGRSDGFGMMFANYLYHAASARVRCEPMSLVWPDTLPHLDQESCASLDQLFTGFSSSVRIIPPGAFPRQSWLRADIQDFLAHLHELRAEFLQLQETPHISAAVGSLPHYDYGIHARAGDVQSRPIQYGGATGRYFPLSGYQEIIDQILSSNPSARIFLSTTSEHLLAWARERHPESVATEQDLFHAVRGAWCPTSLPALWLTIRQLSKAAHLISPLDSAFSLLARITSNDLICHSTPSGYLGLDGILNDLHQDYVRHAAMLFLSPELAPYSPAWNQLIARGWASVPMLVRLKLCAKLLLLA
jgi:hypothetical protein